MHQTELIHFFFSFFFFFKFNINFLAKVPNGEVYFFKVSFGGGGAGPSSALYVCLTAEVSDFSLIVLKSFGNS